MLPKRVVDRHAVPLAAMLAVVTWFMHGVLPLHRWASHLPDGDALSATYHIAWGHHVLWSEPWRYFTLPLFEPQAAPRFFTETNVLTAFLTRPISWLDRPALSYHFALWFGLALTAVASYAALYAWTKHRRASVAGALYFALNADQMYHLWGHPNVLAPFALLPLATVLDRCFRHGRGSAGLAAAIALLLISQALCSLYTGVIAAFVAFGWWGIARAGTRFRGWCGVDATIACGIVAGLLAMYVAAKPYAALRERFGEARSLHHAAALSASVGGYLLPTHVPGAPASAFGRAIAERRSSAQRIENAQFVGVIPALLVGMLAIGWKRVGDRLRRTLVPLGVLALCGFVFSLGPFFWWNDRITEWKLPWYWLYQWFEPLRFMRATARWSVLPSAFIAASIAVCLAQAVWFNGPALRMRVALLGAFVALLAAEFRPVRPIPTKPVAEEGRAALAARPELRRVGAIPLTAKDFLYQSTATFPISPAGTFDGVYNHHYHALTAHFASLDFENQVSAHRALGMEALLIEGDAFLDAAEESPQLRREARWTGGGLYRIAPESTATMILPSFPERPFVPAMQGFPAESVPWVPGDWNRYRASGGAPKWESMPWSAMQAGVRASSLEEKFYGGFEPRCAADLSFVFVRYRIVDPGVSYAKARLWWLAEGSAGWNADHSVECAIVPDGEWRIAVFDLRSAPAYRAEVSIGALQLEPTTTPWPGQLLQLSAIAIVPERSR